MQRLAEQSAELAEGNLMLSNFYDIFGRVSLTFTLGQKFHSMGEEWKLYYNARAEVALATPKKKWKHTQHQ